MATCEKCKKRDTCKEICPELQKEISARGISRHKKEKTYPVDFNLLEKGQFLSDLQLEVKRKTIRDSFLEEITGIDLQNLIQKCLTGREKTAVKFLLDGYSQQEIAKMMKISQRRVSALQSRSVSKLKLFLTGGF